jgi:hypothetical protein
LLYWYTTQILTYCCGSTGPADDDAAPGGPADLKALKDGAIDERLDLKDTAAVVNAVVNEPLAGASRKPPKRRFFVSKGNQWDLVAGVLEEKGWTRIPFDHRY